MSSRPPAGLLVVAAIVLAAPPVPAAEPAPVRIATSTEHSYFPPVEALLRKAYASIGREVEFLAWPLARSHVELSAGRIDGVALRTDAYFDETPFVRKVDVPLLALTLYAYARPPCPHTLPLADLGKYRISYQRGLVRTEALIPAASRRPVNTPSDALFSVAHGSADFALMPSTLWLAEMPLEIGKFRLCKVDQPLAHGPLYHGVHASHAAWVAPLEQALRRMRERGEFQQVWGDYERELGAGGNRLQAQPGRSLQFTPAAPGSAPARPPR